MATYSNLTRASDGQFKVRPSSVGLDSSQPLNEKKLDGQKLDGMSRLGRMSVDVRSSDSIEARATQTLSQQADLSSTHVNLADLEPFEGPPSLVEDAEASSVFQNEASSAVQLPEVAQDKGHENAGVVPAQGKGDGLDQASLPVVVPVDVPVEDSVAVPVEVSVEVPVEVPVDVPVDVPVAVAVEVPDAVPGALSNQMPKELQSGVLNEVPNEDPNAVIQDDSVQHLEPHALEDGLDSHSISAEQPPANMGVAENQPSTEGTGIPAADLSPPLIVNGSGASPVQLTRPPAQIETPYSAGGVMGEGSNAMSGVADALSTLPVATGASSAAISHAGFGMGIGSLTLGVGAGVLTAYYANRKVQRLQAERAYLQSQLNPSAPKSDEGTVANPPSAQPPETTQRQIQRLDNQIQQLKTERAITIGVLSTTTGLGVATTVMASTGALEAARISGSTLGAVGILLSAYGAFTDVRAAKQQSNVNKQLVAGLTELRKTEPPSG